MHDDRSEMFPVWLDFPRALLPNCRIIPHNGHLQVMLFVAMLENVAAGSDFNIVH